MSQRLSMLKKHREYVLQQQKKWEAYKENLDHKIIYDEDAIGKPAQNM